MYYNQTILNSDRYSLYITIIKSDNNMTTEALKHYKMIGENEKKGSENRELHEMSLAEGGVRSFTL